MRASAIFLLVRVYDSDPFPLLKSGVLNNNARSIADDGIPRCWMRLLACLDVFMVCLLLIIMRVFDLLSPFLVPAFLIIQVFQEDGYCYRSVLLFF